MDNTTESPRAPRTTAQQLLELKTGRDLPDLLADMYVRQGKSEVRISIELGISRPTVRQWLSDFGIKRRVA